MNHKQLIILSYHMFTEHDDPYVFSRSLSQFWHDIRKKTYDWITIDDGRACTIEACTLMREVNRRAKLFICTESVGKHGYLTWQQISVLSDYHDIECHSHRHVDHRTLTNDEISESISRAYDEIKFHVNKAPLYFVAPYNLYDERVEMYANQQGMTCLKDRITIKNDTP